jgi:hypothetical protein
VGDLLRFAPDSNGPMPWRVDNISLATGAPKGARVGGPVAPLRDVGMHVYGIDGQHLLQFYQVANQPWELHNVTNFAKSPQVYGNPALQLGTGIFAETVYGDLLQYLWNPIGAGKWEFYSITDGIGPQARIHGDPIVVRHGGSGAVSVYAAGTDHHLWQFYFYQGAWTPWDITALSGGGEISSWSRPVSAGAGGIFACSRHTGRLVQFYFEPTGNWSFWNISDMAGSVEHIDETPTVAPDGGLFVQGNTGNLLHFWLQPGGTWNEQNITDITGAKAWAPFAVSSTSVFAVGEDSHLFHFTRDNSGDWHEVDITNRAGGDYVLDSGPQVLFDPELTIYATGSRGQNANLGMSGQALQATVAPYHSSNASDPDVYHVYDDCPSGKRIPAPNREDGDGGYRRCKHCLQMH